MTARAEIAEAATLEAVTRAGGVVRSARLASDGHARSVIASLVARGQLIRLRRVWVALPDADPLARAAASRGVINTCVTAAVRLGLWVRREGPPHVAAPPHAARIKVANGARVHWFAPIVPRTPDLLFDPIENVLAAVASCVPFEDALAIWESALRQGKVDALSLRRLPFSARAFGVLDAAFPLADSGLETYFRHRLRGLRQPIRSQVWIAGRPVDFLIGDRLVVQIDGGHHVGAQRSADIAHDAQLMLMGYHVIRVGYVQIVHDWLSVHDVIVRAVAQGLHLAA